MTKEQFVLMADYLQTASKASNAMLDLLKFRDDMVLDSVTTMVLYEKYAHQLSEALSFVVMYSGLDDMLKDSLVK
jgi:hypothetical protein